MINFRLIRHLWMFLAVAEEEHFGRAAERLNMSQPPLTEHIKQLEQALGMVLFERSRRGTKLTAAGYSILPAVRKFAEQMQRLQTTVQEIADGNSGILHIGAITMALLEVVPPLIEYIHRHYPKLTVRVREIDSGDAEPLLQSLGFADPKACGACIGSLKADPQGWAAQQAYLQPVPADRQTAVVAALQQLAEG